MHSKKRMRGNAYIFEQTLLAKDISAFRIIGINHELVFPKNRAREISSAS